MIVGRGLARGSIRGVRRRVSRHGLIMQGRTVRTMGRTETRKSLDRGFRCCTTGGRGGRGRDHVHCLRGVLGATAVISSSSGSSRIKVSSVMRMCFRRSSRVRGCGLIASVEKGSVRGHVDVRSPVNVTLGNRGIKSEIRMGMGSGCDCFLRVHSVSGANSRSRRVHKF